MRVRLAIPLLLISILSCHAPLPESYGVYARDGRRLIDLTKEDEKSHFQLSSSSALLVFDRALAQPGFNPNEAFRVFHAGYSRYIHAIHLEPPPSKALELLNASPVQASQVSNLPASITRVAPSGRWIPLGDPLPIRIGPIESRNDLLVIAPSQPLAKGAYILQVDLSGHTSSYAIGVAQPKSEDQRRKASCVDELFYTVRRPDGFLGWDQWFKDINNMQKTQQRRTSEGRPVIAEAAPP